MKHYNNGLRIEITRGLEDGLRKFKKKIEQSDILNEYKERQYYMKPSEKKRKKQKEAKKNR